MGHDAPANGVEQMYNELLNYLRRYSLVPHLKLERMIAEKVSKGLSREEAIAELYRELVERSLEAPAKEERPAGLEGALLQLKESEGEVKVVSLVISLLALSLAFVIAGASSNPAAALAVWFIAMLLAIAWSSRRTRWEYSERIVVEGAGAQWGEVAKRVPKVFQKLTLQNVEWSLEGTRLVMAMNLEKTVLERARRGSSVETVNLGPFRVEAVFADEGGNLVVNAVYRGEPPVAYGGLAAEVYERVIAAFRSSVEEAWSQVKPRATVVLDFARLAELLASKGIVVAAVRCPYCGGSIDLPREGDSTKCPYCGSTVKVIDLYKALRGMIEGLAD